MSASWDLLIVAGFTPGLVSDASGAGGEAQIRGSTGLNGGRIILELVRMLSTEVCVSLTLGRRTLTIVRIAPITDSINQIVRGV